MADSDDSSSFLLCDEDLGHFFQGIEKDPTKFLDDEKGSNYDLYFGPEDEDYIDKLFQKEASFGSENSAFSYDFSPKSQSWLKFARLEAIEWMLNTRAVFGFQFRTAYLSVTYFDRLLSKGTVPDGHLYSTRMLSVACLSLAAKMEESKGPALCMYPVEDYNLESKVIKKLELFVLDMLEWKMGSITPFAYLYHFIKKLWGESKIQEVISRAVELVLAITKVINLMDYRPSIIAAAAALAAASDGQLTRQTMESKISLIPLLGSLENEHIFSCYNLMQEIEMGKFKTAPNLSSSATDRSSLTSLSDGRSKRRLDFEESDQNFPTKKNHI